MHKEAREPLYARKAVLGLVLLRARWLSNLPAKYRYYEMRWRDRRPLPQDFRYFARLCLRQYGWTEEEVCDHFIRTATGRPKQAMASLKDQFYWHLYGPEVNHDLRDKMLCSYAFTTWPGWLLMSDCEPED